MRRKDIGSVVVIALLGGLAGGAAGGFLFPTPVSAQAEPAQVVEAQEFRLVNQEGRLLGHFAVTEQGAMIMLRDNEGQPIWAAPPAGPRLLPLQKKPSH